MRHHSSLDQNGGSRNGTLKLCLIIKIGKSWEYSPQRSGLT